MSNLFNIFSGVHGQQATWLESSSTLARAKQRVEQIAAMFPGSYFIFDIASGRVVYQIERALSARSVTEHPLASK